MAVAARNRNRWRRFGCRRSSAFGGLFRRIAAAGLAARCRLEGGGAVGGAGAAAGDVLAGQRGHVDR